MRDPAQALVTCAPHHRLVRIRVAGADPQAAAGEIGDETPRHAFGRESGNRMTEAAEPAQQRRVLYRGRSDSLARMDAFPGWVDKWSLEMKSEDARDFQRGFGDTGQTFRDLAPVRDQRR